MKHVLASGIAALAVLAAFGMNATAGTFKTITIDDAYGDWAGVPVVDSDAGDNSSGPDIGDTQIANDNDFLYIHNTFPNSLTLPTFLSIDVDGNTATGFDVFGLGLIGSEVAWQNDFPFTQASGVFNDGQGMSGDFFGSGAALLSPFANAPERELAISLNITRNIDNSPVFGGPGSTITMLFWTDAGVGADGLPSFDPNDSGDNFDVSAVIRYTIASGVPEPATCLLAMFGLGFLGVSRRR